VFLCAVAVEGLSCKEMAQILDIPIGTVISRLAQGWKPLYECVKQKPDGK
jgi:DNA-directed RNA polymerase specialized sigma24 family protein